MMCWLVRWENREVITFGKKGRGGAGAIAPARASYTGVELASWPPGLAAEGRGHIDGRHLDDLALLVLIGQDDGVSGVPRGVALVPDGELTLLVLGEHLSAVGAVVAVVHPDLGGRAGAHRDGHGLAGLADSGRGHSQRGRDERLDDQRQERAVALGLDGQLDRSAGHGLAAADGRDGEDLVQARRVRPDVLELEALAGGQAQHAAVGLVAEVDGPLEGAVLGADVERHDGAVGVLGRVGHVLELHGAGGRVGLVGAVEADVHLVQHGGAVQGHQLDVGLGHVGAEDLLAGDFAARDGDVGAELVRAVERPVEAVGPGLGRAGLEGQQAALGGAVLLVAGHGGAADDLQRPGNRGGLLIGDDLGGLRDNAAAALIAERDGEVPGVVDVLDVDDPLGEPVLRPEGHGRRAVPEVQHQLDILGGVDLKRNLAPDGDVAVGHEELQDPLVGREDLHAVEANLHIAVEGGVSRLTLRKQDGAHLGVHLVRGVHAAGAGVGPGAVDSVAELGRGRGLVAADGDTLVSVRRLPELLAGVPRVRGHRHTRAGVRVDKLTRGGGVRGAHKGEQRHHGESDQAGDADDLAHCDFSLN